MNESEEDPQVLDDGMEAEAAPEEAAEAETADQVAADEPVAGDGAEGQAELEQAGAEGDSPMEDGEPHAEGEEGEPAADGEAGEDGAGPQQGEEGAEGAAPAEGEEGAAQGEPPAEGAGEATEAAPAPEDEGPPPPPPYVPPEVGEDYIPVAELPELPLPYNLSEEGKKLPLDGVESMFWTSTTAELLGLGHLGSDKEGGKLVDYVSKEKALHDIQFRGAISDLYIIKAKLSEADYDPLLVRINEDDIYGDGNNYEIVLKKKAADVWAYIEEETARRKQLAIDEKLREQIEKLKPRSQKRRIVKPWVSQGSEQEIEDAGVRARREAISVIIQKRRREFNQLFKLADKDAHELWNSSQMECRPFKDPNFDLRKMEQDVAIQAVPATHEVAIQASGNRPRPNSTAYAPLDLDQAAKQEILNSKSMTRMLERVMYQCEEALIQNEVTNIFTDDFSTLAEEDAVSGNRKEAAITEYQSFTHLTYSKNRVVSAIQWLPHRKGVVAVACTEALSFQDRVAKAGRPSHSHILIWNFKDPIHPEYVLQAPFEVASFQYNPLNPDIIAGGCHNGQLVLWDMSTEYERIAAMKANTNKEEGGDEAQIPVVKWKYASAIEFSHHNLVMDLQWLPGIDATRGRFTKLPDGTKECNFLATISGDGKVNFWDIRFEKLMKKGRKTADDSIDIVWKPIHHIYTISLLGMDLGGTRFCFNDAQLDKGLICLGSFDGELVYTNYVKAEGDDKESTESAKVIQAHVGPVVALQRSPFFDDVLLSVGDWSFQIWREGEPTPLFQSGYAAEYYTSGCWSPTRPAVVYLTDQSGNLEVWDMLDRSHEPSIRVTLSSSPFMSMAFMGGAAAAQSQTHSQFLALGDSSGVLRIVELPRNLRRPVPNEKKLMGSFLGREADRLVDVATRVPLRAKATKEYEELKKVQAEEAERAALAARDAALQGKDQGSAGGPAKAAATAKAALDDKAEAEYAKLEAAFRKQLGLVNEDGSERAITAE